MRAIVRYVAMIGLIGGLLGGAACSGSASAPAASPTTAIDGAAMAAAYAAGGSFSVGVTTMELVDPARGTPANREAPARDERLLTTEIWYPATPNGEEAESRDAPPAMNGGPYPLVVFAHGFSSFRRQSATFAQHLASRGYVVAAPDFPQSNIAAPGGPRISAVIEQPADVSFVIDELLKRSSEPGSLTGAVDAERIAVSGHSLGGLTAMLAGYGPDRDPRVKAIVPISPPGCMLGDDIAEGAAVPTMVIGGSRELIVDPSSIHDAYERASAPKYYVEIIGADHARFGDFDITDEELGDFVSDASEGDLMDDANAVAEAYGADLDACEEGGPHAGDELITGERQRELLREVATPFLDAYLRDDAGAMRFLREALPSLTGVRAESDLGGD